MNNKNKTNGVITVALLAVFLGLLAGVAGQLIAREYLFKSWYSFPFGGELNLTQTDLNSPNLVIKDAQNISVEQEKKVRETIESASNNIVGIFSKKEALLSSEDKLSNIDINNYYDLQDPVGQGITVTSDGWILAPRVDGIQTEEDLGQFVAITDDREVYEIDNIENAPGSSYFFLHLKQAEGLPVKKFTSEGEIKAGEMILALDWQKRAFLTSIVGKEQQEDLVKSSDVFQEEILTGKEVPQYYDSAFVFNLKNGIVGVYNGNNQIQSINNFRVYINNLLREGAKELPSLGVNYVDLSQVLLSATEYEKGALIYPNTGGVAVEKGSIAEEKGLQRGDIITQVNNKKIEGNISLNYLLARHTSGDTITLTYLREGESNTISLTLSKNKEE